VTRLTILSRTEKEPQDVTAHEQSYLLGLCTGLFAACAVASTPSVSTLIPLAVQVVLMAFRAGSHVASMAERLSPSSSNESWNHLFAGLQESAAISALESFHTSQARIPFDCYSIKY
jgi:starter unit:ACP transacylase-like protein